MLVRVVSAVILAPLFLFLIYLGGKYLATAILLLALLALREYFQIGRKAGWLRPQEEAWPMILCAAWLALFWLNFQNWLLPALYFCFFLLMARYVLIFPAASFLEVIFQISAFFYPVIFFTYLQRLRDLPGGFEWCLFAVLTVWLTDSAAYFIGSLAGRHKLAPRVSPNKSVEGSVAGVVVAVIFGCTFAHFSDLAPLGLTAPLALAISFAAQLGDLFESALKRAANIKDSGRFIPGHGGVLDRFDSFLLTMPLVYYTLFVYHNNGWG
ncbi:MAG: phosphatidate cytidylyltransferase [Gracilibacteraceae bacterium]|jgi:phosphatidate cytidylyltransferase|nr:phosphatidate cytidylyltransferase [Gracilibacteraceae bacterium]